MTEREKPDLSSIEPIGRVPDADDEPRTEAAVARVGPTAAADPGSSPAVGVEPDAGVRARDAEPKTSPETDAELEQLRRG
jgi:hypothetical protein